MAGEIFISYRRADQAWAQLLHSQLRAEGVEAWYDAQVGAGQDWRIATAKALETSQIFVLLFSENAAQSSDIAKELAAATLEKKLIIPVRLQNIAPKGAFLYELASRNWVNAYEDTEAKLAELAKGLAHLVRTGARDESVLPFERADGGGHTPAAAGRKSMRTPAIIAAAAVLVIAVSGLAAWLLWRSPRPDIEAESAKTAAPVSAAPVKAETTEAAFKPPARSVAVLAFTDMSEKKDQEYFADGLSEELIDLLTKVPDLRVPARTSSFYFKGKPAQLGEIAKALNVANVLEGSVRRAGSAVRITTHLVRVDSGYDVWSQTYDRDMKNIFQTQDEIAGAVVQALKLKLLTAGSAADRTVNIEAYSLLLRGRYLNARASEADLRNATQILQRAVALDPDYALAWSELSLSYDRLSNLYDADPVRDTEAGRAAVQRALALNPADAPAHYLLATIKVTYEHDWNGAVAEMDAARRADPNLTTPLGLVFVSGCNSGPCHEKFIRDISRDLDRDPLNAFTLSDRAYAHYYAGELEAAESDIRRSMELSPSLVDGNFLLARILVAEHKAVDALSVIQSAPDSFYRRAGLALVYQALGRKAEADAAFQDLLSKDSRDAPFQIADVFAARGNNSAALDWLQRDYDLKMYGILDAKVDPLLKPLAREPRFIALMSKLAPIQ